MRSFYLTLLVLPAAAGGCAWQKDLDEARRQASQYRLQIRDLQAQQAREQPNHTLLKAQRERLEAENQVLKRQIEELRKRERDLNARLAAVRAQDERVRAELEAQRAELNRALEAIHQSRQEWERTLADRQKQIDMLANQVQRLTRRHEVAGRVPGTTTHPQ